MWREFAVLIFLIVCSCQCQSIPPCFAEIYTSSTSFEYIVDATANAQLIGAVQRSEPTEGAPMVTTLRTYNTTFTNTLFKDADLSWQSEIDEHGTFLTMRQVLVDELAMANISLLIYAKETAIHEQAMPCPNTTQIVSYFANGTSVSVPIRDACLVWKQTAYPNVRILSMKHAWLAAYTNPNGMQWITFLSKNAKHLLKQIVLVPNVIDGYTVSFEAPKIQHNDVYIFVVFDLGYDFQIAFEHFHQLQHDTVIRFPANATSYTKVQVLAVYSLIQNQFVSFFQLDFSNMASKELPFKYASFHSLHIVQQHSFTLLEYKIVLSGSITYVPQIENAAIFTCTIREPFIELVNPSIVALNNSEKSSVIMSSQLHNTTMLLVGGMIDFVQAETGSIVTPGTAYLGLFDLTSMRLVAKQQWGTSGRNNYVSRLRTIDSEYALVVQVLNGPLTHDTKRHQQSAMHKLRVADLYHCVPPVVPDNTILYIFLLGCGVVGILIIALVAIVFVCRYIRQKSQTYTPI